MIRFLATLGLIFALVVGVSARPGPDSNYNVAISSGGGGCAQATAIIARMDGTQSAHNADITTFICGAVSDGFWAKMEWWHWQAASSTANANLNWTSTSFNLACSNSTFTAWQGYTGNNFNSFCDPGYTPSVNHAVATVNSTSLGACILTNRTTSQPYNPIGGSDATNDTSILPLAFSLNSIAEVSDSGFNLVSGATTAAGTWIANRTSATALALTQGTTTLFAVSQAVGALVTTPIYVDAKLQNGTLQVNADQIAFDFYGVGLISTDITNIVARTRAFMTAVNGGGC